MSPRSRERIVLALFVVAIAVAFIVATVRPAGAAVVEMDGNWIPVDVIVETRPAITDDGSVAGETGCARWAPVIARHFPTDVVAEAIAICQCESGGDPTAVSPTDDHGLFQHHDASYARIRFTETGSTWADRYDPEANVAAAAWLWRQDGWRPWSCRHATANAGRYRGAVIGETIDVIAGGDDGLTVERSTITAP